MSRSLAVLLCAAVGAGAAALSCDSGQSCTEVGCDHEAVVTYPSGLLSAAYELTLSFPGVPPISARCADPGAPELADNPEGLTCDLSGFSLVGELAVHRDVIVQITDTETGEELVAGTEVRLEAVDELTPNGPDCPPTCFVRNGQLVVGVPQ